jgi:hypothetical protein
LKKVSGGDNVEEIKSALTELSAEIQKIGQALYNQKEGGEGETKS